MTATLAQSLTGIVFALAWFGFGYAWRMRSESERVHLGEFAPHSFDSEPEEVPGGFDLEDANV